MESSILVLLPPIIVISVAIFTRNVIWSLVAGILGAALIATEFSPISTITLIFKRIFDEIISPDHLYTYGFLIALGILISLMTHTGGISAYTKIIKKKLSSKKAAETNSLLLSPFFFLDDYLNSLTVGSIMRPITDSFKIPRVKLAYLLDTMSAPYCVLIPASSWVAVVLSQLETSGLSESKTAKVLISGDSFLTYLKSIPYMLYPIAIVLSTWFVVRNKISFGSMRKHEIEAEKTGNLFGGKQPIIVKEEKVNPEGSILDFILPIGTLIFTLLIYLLYSGGWKYLGGTESLFNALLHANALLALFVAGLVSLAISSVYYLSKKSVDLKKYLELSFEGASMMKNSILLLTLAWTLGTLLKTDLNTGGYLAHVLLQSLPQFLIPIMFFATALIITASTGSSWGTVAIIMPFAIPTVAAFVSNQYPIDITQAHLIYPVIGAILSGSIAGGHLSPISDSTILASTSSGSYHLDHVSTQFSYVLPTVVSSVIGLLIIGIFANYNQLIVWPIALGTTLLISFAILYLRNKNN